MKKLTKREKVILGLSTVVLVVVGVKLKHDVFKAGAAYNRIADKLCSGGAWTAINVTPKSFNLVRIEP